MTIYNQDHFSTDPQDVEQDEVECKRCYGTGEDSVGADCIFCEGMGTLLIG